MADSQDDLARVLPLMRWIERSTPTQICICAHVSGACTSQHMAHVHVRDAICLNITKAGVLRVLASQPRFTRRYNARSTVWQGHTQPE